MDEKRVIRSSRVYKYSVEELFEAFSNPESLAQWWGPKGFSCTFKEFNFVEGGEWIFTMHGPDGTNYANHHKFLEIIPNAKIVTQHLGAPKFTMTMTYEAVEGGAKLSWLHEFESEEVRNSIAKIAESANEENFDRLDDFITSQRG